MTYKNTLFGLLIIIFAAWLTLPTNRSTLLTPENMNILPDAWMEDVTAIIMDQQGKPKIKIISPQVIHYSEQNTSQLLTPHITLYKQSPTPWYISARYAKAIQGVEQIHFWQNVVIQHAAAYHQPAMLIKTDKLTVHPQEQTADTTEMITLFQPDLTVKAKGMHTNMKTGDIKLLSNARGEYVPKY